MAEIVTIGDATLYLGDCLELMKQIPDQSIDMVLCDLPYGTTQNKWDSVIPFNDLWSQYKRICKGAIVLTAQSPFDKSLGASNIEMLKYEWIWEKEMGSGHLNAKKAPLKNHENVLVFYAKQPTYNPQFEFNGKPYVAVSGKGSSNYGSQVETVTENDGRRYPKTVIKFSRDREKVHPTQKPVALMEYMIRTYTNENNLVLDNTMGSGTTGVACLNTNRKFIGMEQDKAYFDIACERIRKVKESQGLFA
jgi:site-specific DNA-methyltransferase (adenine-specific)